jgi:hypothetical protein
LLVVVDFLLFTDGRGSGGNANAEMGDGAKSTNLQRWTAMVVSFIAAINYFFLFLFTNVDHQRGYKLISLGSFSLSLSTTLHTMSFLGIGSGGSPQSNSINHDRIEMAITEFVHLTLQNKATLCC